MPWYFYLALKQLFPTGRVCSFFALVSIVGVMLGVMVLIIVQSVMNGFGHEIRKTIVETGGDIRIEGDVPIYDVEPMITLTVGVPGVEAAAPYAQGIVLLQYGNLPSFPYIRGIDLEREKGVVPIEEYLIAGSLADLDNESILLSSQLAATLGAHVGSRVDVYSPLMIDRLNNDEIFLPRELEVVGIFETGWNQVDSQTVICSLPLMQELYDLGNSVHGIAVRLQPSKNADKVVAKLNDMLPYPYRAITSLDLNRDLLFVLRLEKSILFFIIIFVVLVATFSIASSLMTTVLRKTREIGILAALGATPRDIAFTFCIQGFLIGVAGSLLGVVFSLTALHYRNAIVHLFARLTHSEAALLKFYQFTNIPTHYLLSDFLVIIPMAIVFSTLAGLLPAWRAARMKPSEALRSE
jgi:lipoprotein-releasing system permease protein